MSPKLSCSHFFHSLSLTFTVTFPVQVVSLTLRGRWSSVQESISPGLSFSDEAEPQRLGPQLPAREQLLAATMKDSCINSTFPFPVLNEVLPDVLCNKPSGVSG